jgi:hypothetical protein
MIIDVSLRTRDPGPYAADRRCAHPDCITILHRYHFGLFCYLHEDEDRRARGLERPDFLMEEAA